MFLYLTDIVRDMAKSKKPLIPKNIKIVIGVICTILGLAGAVPSFLTSQYGVATGGSILVVIGVIFFALGFED